MINTIYKLSNAHIYKLNNISEYNFIKEKTEHLFILIDHVISLGYWHETLKY